jgi:hypothetical protein
MIKKFTSMFKPMVDTKQGQIKGKRFSSNLTDQTIHFFSICLIKHLITL